LIKKIDFIFKFVGRTPETVITVKMEEEDLFTMINKDLDSGMTIFGDQEIAEALMTTPDGPYIKQFDSTSNGSVNHLDPMPILFEPPDDSNQNDAAQMIEIVLASADVEEKLDTRPLKGKILMKNAKAIDDRIDIKKDRTIQFKFEEAFEGVVLGVLVHNSPDFQNQPVLGNGEMECPFEFVSKKDANGKIFAFGSSW